MKMESVDQDIQNLRVRPGYTDMLSALVTLTLTLTWWPWHT